MFDIASLARAAFDIVKVYSLFVFLLEWSDYYFDHFYSHTFPSIFFGRSVLDIFIACFLVAARGGRGQEDGSGSVVAGGLLVPRCVPAAPHPSGVEGGRTCESVCGNDWAWVWDLLSSGLLGLLLIQFNSVLFI